MPTAVLEAVLRPDVTWRPVALVLALVVVLSLLWRRTHPLGAVLAVFGTLIVVDIAALVGGVGELRALHDRLRAPPAVRAVPLGERAGGRARAGGDPGGQRALGIAGDYTGSRTPCSASCSSCRPRRIGAWVRLASTSRLRERDQVRLREREQLARELHDTVAHHVSAIAVRAQAGRVVAASDPSAALDALVVIEGEASRALTEMRLMVSALRDDDAADLAPQRGVADIERLAAGGAAAGGGRAVR